VRVCVVRNGEHNDCMVVPLTVVDVSRAWSSLISAHLPTGHWLYRTLVVQCTSFGDASFAAAGRRLWNTLKPNSIKLAGSKLVVDRFEDASNQIA